MEYDRFFAMNFGRLGKEKMNVDVAFTLLCYQVSTCGNIALIGSRLVCSLRKYDMRKYEAFHILIYVSAEIVSVHICQAKMSIDTRPLMWVTNHWRVPR